MRAATAFLSALAVALAVGGCEADLDLEAERAALLHADESWAAAAEAGDVDRLFGYWTEDAVIYPPVGPTVEGLDAIREFVRAARARPGFSLTWTPTGAEVAAKADVGYTFGLWRGTREGPDGTTVTNAGSYVSIWRKQPDGSWRCSVEISNLGELTNLGERPAR